MPDNKLRWRQDLYTQTAACAHSSHTTETKKKKQRRKEKKNGKQIAANEEIKERQNRHLINKKKGNEAITTHTEKKKTFARCHTRCCFISLCRRSPPWCNPFAQSAHFVFRERTQQRRAKQRRKWKKASRVHLAHVCWVHWHDVHAEVMRREGSKRTN